MKNHQRTIRGICALGIAVVAALVGGITVKSALIAATPETAKEKNLDKEQQAEVQAVLTKATSTKPVQLRIPAINVDASIDDVGISIHNTIAVPEGYSDVGWYRYGPVPGALGTAIMDGHLDNGFGLAAVFHRLKELKEGDRIYIKNAGGKVLEFSVSEQRTVKNDASTRDLFAQHDGARLVLITCEGQWLSEEEMYTDRLLVIAEYKGIVSE
jgi:LPXTG-site transpeptidase (sortase) family protein